MFEHIDKETLRFMVFLNIVAVFAWLANGLLRVIA